MITMNESEYDKRQLNIMILKIHSFNKGHLYLSDLIDDLEGLLYVLKFDDPNWKQRFRYYWGYLERIYAVSLDQGKTSLDSNAQKVVFEGIEHLEKMVNEKLLEFRKCAASKF